MRTRSLQVAVRLLAGLAATILLLPVATAQESGHSVAVYPDDADRRTFVVRRPWDGTLKTRVGFELVVRPEERGAEQRVFRRAGEYTLDLPSDSTADTPVSTTISIERIPRENISACPQGASTPIDGTGSTTREECSKRLTFAGRARADGRYTSLAFRTREGTLCRVPRSRRRAAWLASRLSPGEKVLVCGRPQNEQNGKVVTVEHLAHCPLTTPPARQDGWRVRVEPPAGAPREFCWPGIYRLELQTGNERKTQVRFHLREVKTCELSVGGHRLSARVVDTPDKRSYGLQGRSGLPADHGMLFVFSRPFRPSFVMKKVSFPLAIAFIRPDGRIANIELRDPGDQRPARPTERVRYVLEMRRGWFSERHLGAGARVEFLRSAQDTSPKEKAREKSESP